MPIAVASASCWHAIRNIRALPPCVAGRVKSGCAMKVARKGNLLGVQVDRSSGFEVLDQHALAMLEALAGLPPLPEALEANEIQVVVPINYKLKKTT